MPAVFLGHGNPMNAIQHKAHTDAWRALAATSSSSSRARCSF
jgi:aromatic ring-opening dioxygenase catalytic subunit (LigB family)